MVYEVCMRENKITKTLSLNPIIVRRIEEAAKAEKRSFTSQVELMLESVLKRRQGLKTKPETVSA
jgi:hypothetical protein